MFCFVFWVVGFWIVLEVFEVVVGFDFDECWFFVVVCVGDCFVGCVIYGYCVVVVY